MVVSSKSISVFASRLRSARKAAGISQMELGVLAGIDEYSASARVNQYERGKHTPDYQTAGYLAQALGIPTAYLYCDDEILAELIRLYGLATAEQKSALLDYAQALRA